MRQWPLRAAARGQHANRPSRCMKCSAYLDGRVGVQENQKNVRCWSSFNKLQEMFITNCEISEEAKSERIEKHMRLIRSIWGTMVIRRYT